MGKISSVLAAVVAALSACSSLGGGRRLSRGPEIPAAEGTVRFVRIAGDDTGIELNVRHLAEPDLLLPPGYVYVAWVRAARETPPQNVGALELGADLNGVLRTTTPLRRFELFVTAEATRDAAQPAGPHLLWASRD
jgi:hypothetical protein